MNGGNATISLRLTNQNDSCRRVNSQLEGWP